MGAADDNAKSETRPGGIGPGDRLQAARIQKGLSIEDVANRMHLSANILEAIEENNFEEITAPIFVKGYLRAYARIVALDEDEMIQQYIAYYSEEDPPISSTSNMAPELSANDARIKWTTYLVIVVLAALLAAWWWNKEQNDETPISLDTQGQEASQTEQAEVNGVSSEIEAVSESALDSTEVAEPPPPPEPTAVIEAPEPAPPPPAPVEAEPVAMPQDVDDAVDDQASEPAPPQRVAVGESGATAPGGSDRLMITVIADTWADIKDANDYQLVYDLLRADQTVELTGTAPFSVFLGNGHGVEINFNDEEIEFSGRIRNDNTARLKIGG